ncbi:pentatricopeptide repeat-containing protein At4g21190 isoform X1 [Arachis hypogaea]|nr:pentatricopeptide repeat-containing protein At4g21190 isoform X1 [Arachis hypogaea]
MILYTYCSDRRMHALGVSPLLIAKTFQAMGIPSSTRSTVVCAAKGPRPRYPRVWKTHKRVGTINKAAKLVETIRQLSNVKEEVYGALDSYVAWELEFPLITMKKALKTLEDQQEWKRVIQVTKWMLSKGQGRTMGSYFTLLIALAEDDRIDEAEELWTKLLMQYMESLPRKFFDKMISIYYKRGMYDKMFEVFADMEELGVHPNLTVVQVIGSVFKEVGMLDKYEKIHQKYPPPRWKYRYVKGGRRIKVKVSGQPYQGNYREGNEHANANGEPNLDLDDNDTSEETSELEEVDEQFNQDANARTMESKQISDDSFETKESVLDV